MVETVKQKINKLDYSIFNSGGIVEINGRDRAINENLYQTLASKALFSEMRASQVLRLALEQLQSGDT